jgi:hypothetical protein
VITPEFLVIVQTINAVKKTLTGSLLAVVCLGLQAQTISIGSTGVYGDDIDAFGINFRSYYNTANHRMCLGPEVTFFNRTEMSHGNEVDLSLFEFNFNGHYVFEVSEKLGINPIIGLNYSREEENEIDQNEEITKIKDDWGLLAGVGFHYFVHHRFFIIGEYDHLFSELRQNTYTLGVLYSIRLKKDHH